MGQVQAGVLTPRVGQDRTPKSLKAGEGVAPEEGLVMSSGRDFHRQVGHK